jgi:hypothetical protein
MLSYYVSLSSEFRVVMSGTISAYKRYSVRLYPGADQGGAPGAPPLPKIGKNMIFWRKIVIFHTKYPQNFRSFLRSAQFFLSAPPLA